MTSSNLPDVAQYTYTSILAQQMYDYVAMKRTLGYKFHTEALRLREFDCFLVRNNFNDTVITKQIFETWYTPRPNETEANRILRYGTVNRFSKYLVQMGFNSYVSAAKVRWKCKDFKAYIFTDDEMGRFLKEAHIKPMRALSKTKYLVSPMLFTTLACTGLRIGEALNLKHKNIIFSGDTVLLHIFSEKHEKERRIPLGKEMGQRLLKYLDELALVMPSCEYVFPAPSGQPYKHASIHSTFKTLLWKAGISYGGRGKGPRIHDIRHTFAVKSLRKLALSEKDPNEVFHFLSRYMGHKDLSATQSYIQLTAELFPHIIRDMEEYIGHLIPALEVYEDETN
jgi:integrase